MKIKRNDEWDYADALGHNPLVVQIGHRLLSCYPPYVVGIGGSWGSGKTSFLRKLWAYLGGDIEWDEGKIENVDKANKRGEWFQDSLSDFKGYAGGKKVELVC